MKRTKAMILFGLVMALWVCGCQSVFNPYDDTFQCPEVSEGKCASISSAYRESLSGKADPSEACPGKGNCTDGKAPEIREHSSGEDAKTLYQKKKFELLHSLIDSGEPPIVAPPEVGRVLILSYTGDENEMFGYRYIYFFATDPSWLLTTAKEGDPGEGP